MSKMRHLRKRILSVLLTVMIFLSSILSSASLIHVNAASWALDAEGSMEMVMLIYDLLETAMIACGVKEGVSDYSSGQGLLAAFNKFIDGMIGMPDFDAQMESLKFNVNGFNISAKDYLEYIATDGSSALQLPDEDTFVRFRVINGGSSGDPSGEEPENKGPFEKISAFQVGAGFVGMIGDFINKIFVGDKELAGVANPGAYWDNLYTGELQPDVEGNYHYYGTFFDLSCTQRNNNERLYTINYTTSDHLVGYLLSDGSVSFRVFLEGTDHFYKIIPACLERYDGLRHSGTPTHANENPLRERCRFSYSVNFPIFASYDDMMSYINGMEDSAALNKAPYGYPGMIRRLGDTLKPLLDKELSPNVLPEVNEALVDALETLPEPDPDPAAQDANTQAYEEAVSDVVSEVVPEAHPDPSPGTDTDPSLDVDMNMNDYQVDLTRIFPFCLPFDLIHLLQALDAEPEAPCFEFPIVIDPLNINETVEIDLSFMDEAVQVFRIGELGLFIIGLIVATRKMIKW